MSDLNPATTHLLYEVDDNPPLSVSLPLVGHTIALILAGITLTPIIALTAAGIVFGLALWLGIGLQNQQLFDGLVPDYLASLLNNGMTAGGIAAVFLSWLVSLKNKRQANSVQPLDRAGLAGALAFVNENARESDWRGEDLNRLALAVEEAFIYMMSNTPEGIPELELRIRAAADHAEVRPSPMLKRN